MAARSCCICCDLVTQSTFTLMWSKSYSRGTITLKGKHLPPLLHSVQWSRVNQKWLKCLYETFKRVLYNNCRCINTLLAFVVCVMEVSFCHWGKTSAETYFLAESQSFFETHVSDGVIKYYQDQALCSKFCVRVCVYVCATSKKECAVRRAELLEPVSRPLIQYIVQYGRDLVTNNAALLLLLTIITHAKGWTLSCWPVCHGTLVFSMFSSKSHLSNSVLQQHFHFGITYLNSKNVTFTSLNKAWVRGKWYVLDVLVNQWIFFWKFYNPSVQK